MKIFKKVGFTGDDVDPCLNMTNGIVYVALYIDDNLMAENSEAIDDAI